MPRGNFDRHTSSSRIRPAGSDADLRSSRALVAVGLLAVLGTAGAASGAAGAARESLAAARSTTAGYAHLEAGSFLFARYASVNASTLYAGVGLGQAGLFVGFAQNPRSGYGARLLGAMTRVVWPERYVTLGLAIADASDGTFAQVYVLPGISKGALTFESTIVWSEPLASSGARQLEVNPAIVLWRLGSRFSAGASYVGSFSAGSPGRQRAGPLLRLAILRQTIDLEWLAAGHQSRGEVRIALHANL